MSFIAGAYNATYKSLALGQTQKGFDIEWQQVLEEVTSDVFRGMQDGIYQGVNLLIRTVLIEPDAAGVNSLIWPWNSTIGTTGVIGRNLKSLAGPLILTRCNSSLSATPATITIPKAIIWKDKVSSNYENAQRKIPVVIAGLAVDASSDSAVIGCSGANLFTTA